MFTARVLEIVFDVNRRRGRTYKHSGRSNLIFSLDSYNGSYDLAERGAAARERGLQELAKSRSRIMLKDRDGRSFLATIVNGISIFFSRKRECVNLEHAPKPRGFLPIKVLKMIERTCDQCVAGLPLTYNTRVLRTRFYIDAVTVRWLFK